MNPFLRKVSFGLAVVTFTVTSPVLLAAEAEPLLGGGLFDIVRTGGEVMVIILLGSVVGLALALERLVALRRSTLVPTDYLNDLNEAVSSKNLARVEDLAKGGKGPLARILQAGFRGPGRSPSDMERAMESRGRHEVVSLRRPVRPLAILATISPLLGLLGTILGMIATFNMLGDTSPADRVETLAPGIGKALYTTAAGLCVAIPFVILYHLLTGRILRAASEWGILGTDVVALAASVERGETVAADPVGAGSGGSDGVSAGPGISRAATPEKSDSGMSAASETSGETS